VAKAPRVQKAAKPARRSDKVAKRAPVKAKKSRPQVAPKAVSRVAAIKPAAPRPEPAPMPAAAPPRPSIRLAGSASSRLTIKPSPPTGPRPQLELSTKVRPGGPRRLSEVELDEDEVLIDGFDATLDGARVRITAVLERTCVYVHPGGDRRLARKEDLWVEADKLPIRRRSLS
jgi:hypothetical protein